MPSCARGLYAIGRLADVWIFWAHNKQHGEKVTWDRRAFLRLASEPFEQLGRVPSVPATTVPEFIAHAKTNPGKLSMASGGIGSPGHLSGELFKMMTGVNMAHVPYRGGAPALTDLLAGQVQVYFSPTLAAIEYIRLASCARSR